MMLLDSCVLINLLATGRLEDIARHFPSPAAVCPVVRNEAIFLRNPPGAEPGKVRISLEPFIGAGTLVEASLQTEEEKNLYVSLAMRMDDGEAMAMAIAIQRGDYLATDDATAMKVYAEAGGDPAKLRSTPDLVKAWAEAGRSTEEVAAALRLIQVRAKYQPPASHGLCAWWMARLS